ncbi:hypothetical protein [Amycolatopsis sp. lyj-84]|uniref:hypothetical protein n=1 Tax=Amycolatopsis sp. lyj-84 TaxID=2789284 RepID=UPI003979BAB1
MIRGELQDGEKVVPPEVLAEWDLRVGEGWTVTIRPDVIDQTVSPLTFEVGKYTAHDQHEFLAKRLVFLMLVAEVYDRAGMLIGSEEFTGVEWRPPGLPRDLHVGQADIGELVTDAERRWMVTNAVSHAIQSHGSKRWGRKREDRPVLYGLRATVLRPLTFPRPDHSRVISSDPTVGEVFIVGDDVPKAQPVREGFPLVLLKETRAGDLAVRPANDPPSGHTAYAASGAYVVHFACGREWFELFGHVLPVSLHDLTMPRGGA